MSNQPKNPSPNDPNDPARDPRAALALVARYLAPMRGRVAVLAALLLGGIGLQLAIPQMLRAFIDHARDGAPVAALAATAGVFLGLALANEAANALTTFVGQDVRWRATNALRADLTRHCLRLGMPFHNAQTPGKMIERIDGDVTELSNLMSDYALRALGNGILLFGVLVMLAREDGRLGLAYAGFVVVTLVALGRTIGFATAHWERAREAAAELFGFFEERLSGLEDLRAGGAGDWVRQGYHDGQRALMHVERRAFLLGSTSWIAAVALFTAGNLLALGMGAWLFQGGAITLGTVYLVFHYTEMLRHPIEQLADQLRDLQRAGGGLRRVVGLLAEPERPERPPEEAVAVPGGALSVAFEGVTFGYHDGAPVLDDVRFALAPGQVLGLLGRTGSGKSTIARLLFRLYDVQGGAVRVGGVDVRDARRRDLRRRIGMVTQDVQLFQATLRDNLAFFDRTVPDDRLTAALEDLGLGEWFRRLPDGLDTELASGGGGLSAGEAQLLAFTRVFLSDPGLVILDEASSRLDPATELLIERAVDRLMVGRTGIVIAHRLGTVQRADAILILEKGRVREHGARLDLVADPASRFNELLRTGMEEVLA